MGLELAAPGGRPRRSATEFESVEQIQDAVSSCTDCRLCKSRSNAVAGEGHSKADIVFVGEAPGRGEDASGKPFVGAAGRRLSEVLRRAGVSRESVYITNTVKCRPPENRTPAPDEVESCRKYLDEEIRLIRPKVVCVMGNVAYGSLLEGGNITRDRGRTVRRHKQTYFLTVHPAATIYRPALTEKFEEDIARLVDIIRGSG